METRTQVPGALIIEPFVHTLPVASLHFVWAATFLFIRLWPTEHWNMHQHRLPQPYSPWAWVPARALGPLGHMLIHLWWRQAWKLWYCKCAKSPAHLWPSSGPLGLYTCRSLCQQHCSPCFTWPLPPNPLGLSFAQPPLRSFNKVHWDPTLCQALFLVQHLGTQGDRGSTINFDTWLPTLPWASVSQGQTGEAGDGRHLRVRGWACL